MPTTRLQSRGAAPKTEETNRKPVARTPRRREKGTTKAAAPRRKSKKEKVEGKSDEVEDQEAQTEAEGKAGEAAKRENEHLRTGTHGGDEEAKGEKDRAGQELHGGRKRKADEITPDSATEEPPAKKRRGNAGPRRKEVDVVYKEGVIERGHVYFFYRPKVQVEEVESLDDVRNLQMVLVPRPPVWLQTAESSAQPAGEKTTEKKEEVNSDMRVLSPGADVVPAPEPKDTTEKKYRVITIGKKHLPTLELMSKTSGRGRRPIFWGTVSAEGDDLEELEKGMGEKTYETKTRGTRHMVPARLVARGVYAIVNREAPRVPSERETHFAYRISHPPPEEMREVQHAFGILDAAAFVIQIKNPLAPSMTPSQRSSHRAQYPEELMRAVFGAGTGGKGRNEYGLRFAPLETPELLDYKGAEILFIAAREGQAGVEESIGEERGRAMKEADKQEERETIDEIYRELGLDMERFPPEPLEGEWM